MKKIHVAINIIVLSIVPTFLVGCGALDDFVRVIIRNGADNVQPKVPGKPARIPLVHKNHQNELVKKCSRQAGKSAVVEAWERVNSSGRQVDENYLLSVTWLTQQLQIFRKIIHKLR
jgi:hypothetical protein